MTIAVFPTTPLRIVYGTYLNLDCIFQNLKIKDQHQLTPMRHPRWAISVSITRSQKAITVFICQRLAKAAYCGAGRANMVTCLGKYHCVSVLTFKMNSEILKFKHACLYETLLRGQNCKILKENTCLPRNALKPVYIYLTNISQRVKVVSPYSTCRYISIGVLQGSVAEPLLLNILINDIFYMDLSSLKSTTLQMIRPCTHATCLSMKLR